MQRIPEPELMDDTAQARAYAEADFSEPHQRFVTLFQEAFPGETLAGTVLDLGCGPADVTLRLARAYPLCRIDGLDGAAAMLECGREAVRRAGLDDRVRLVEGYLPGAVPPLATYDAVVSNSLLHHLADPRVLWASIRRWGGPGAPVLVMDLMRPDGPAAVDALVLRYAADAPAVLRRDFEHSLRAAYRVEEVRAQLVEAGLPTLAVRPVDDHHLAVWGRLD
ncbi:Ubiquinone/menaquinone biosynthesis C-methylase UbiE [Methylomagnum ishizawai]|uniref:Ubiquinone/menaquinone biosynthesis C-methylase UbiE n=1 Tax=Methylomagnum ishizawai TaxID=1760988 RepID=A0A1Y6CZ57_9GAMM|nr:class I SAM-dependent methyltransferase [Methylomagnum ishizawai]SMF93853.1 Ubiquinone/menaquinone biosynthesis C-methylase UbiE [Methylomagnum ishizawai]